MKNKDGIGNYYVHKTDTIFTITTVNYQKFSKQKQDRQSIT